MNQKIISALEKLGYKAKLVAAVHGKELVEEIDSRYKKGQIYSRIYEDYLRFNIEDIEEKGSLLIAAVKLPIINLMFRWNKKEFPVIIPSGYICSDIVEKFNKQIEALFINSNYNLKKCQLPLKLLANRSTLAKYGRNNIAYIDGFGSFHMLACYYTDMPCNEDVFVEPSIAEECVNCSICTSSCPSGALSKESFMVNAGRCITYQNEIDGVFEEWIDQSWHNSLIGCFYCQGRCPMNKPYLSDIRTYPAFTEEETIAFYNAAPLESLSSNTKEKLKAIEFYDSYSIFIRNLKALIDKNSMNERPCDI